MTGWGRGRSQRALRGSWKPALDVAGLGRGRLNIVLVLRTAQAPSASAFIRLISPLSHPAFGRRVGIHVIDKSDLTLPPETDVCIVQRTALPGTKVAKAFLADVRARGCVLIVDSDDAFTMLDPDHPQHASQSKRADALAMVMEAADEVWLSTEALSRAQTLTRPPVIMSNALDPRLWRAAKAGIEPIGPEDPLRILCMGTPTHDGDFAMIRPALDRLHTAHPGQFHVSIVGVTKDELAAPWLRQLTPPSKDYRTFVPWLLAQGPFDTGLSPLVDSAFNRCKSDIKVLDYLALGARPIVSDVEPYGHPGLDDIVTRVPGTVDAWFAALEAAVVHRARDRESLSQWQQRAHTFVSQERSIDAASRHMGERIAALRR